MDKYCYIFDLDGTLINSMPAFCKIVKRILGEKNIAYGDDLIKIVTPLGYAGTAKYFKSLGLDGSVEEIIELMQNYIYEDYEKYIPAKEGVVETLKKMKELGASLNVLTACPHRLLDTCLKRLGIFDLFDKVYSCDDFGTTKTNPDIYLQVSQRLSQKPSDIVFVDDNVNAVKTAKIAGLNSYGIFDESSKEYVEEMKKEGDKYLWTFRELLD